MKKILSERNLVVVLFIAALTIFSFAQEDAKKAEKLNQYCRCIFTSSFTKANSR